MQWQSEVACEVVESADRHDAQGGFGIDQRLDDRVDRAVAARGHEKIEAEAHLFADDGDYIDALGDSDHIQPPIPGRRLER